MKSILKPKFLLGIALLTLSSVFFAVASDNDACVTNPVMPFKAVTNVDERTFLQETLRKAYQLDQEEPLLVNLWAIWCPPCRDELPLLNEIHEVGNIKVVLINLGDPEKAGNALLKELQVNVPNIYADSGLLRRLKLRGVPASFIFYEDSVFMGMGALRHDHDDYAKWFSCLTADE